MKPGDEKNAGLDTTADDRLLRVMGPDGRVYWRRGHIFWEKEPTFHQQHMAQKAKYETIRLLSRIMRNQRRK